MSEHKKQHSMSYVRKKLKRYKEHKDYPDGVTTDKLIELLESVVDQLGIMKDKGMGADESMDSRLKRVELILSQEKRNLK